MIPEPPPHLISPSGYTSIESDRPEVPETELFALDVRYLDAVYRKDSSALEAIHSDAYWMISPGGNVVARKERIASIVNRTNPIESIAVIEREFRMINGIARVLGVYEVRAKVAGKLRFARYRFVRLYIRESGSWKLLTDQDTQLAFETIER